VFSDTIFEAMVAVTRSTSSRTERLSLRKVNNLIATRTALRPARPHSCETIIQLLNEKIDRRDRIIKGKFLSGFWFLSNFYQACIISEEDFQRCFMLYEYPSWRHIFHCASTYFNWGYDATKKEIFVEHEAYVENDAILFNAACPFTRRVQGKGMFDLRTRKLEFQPVYDNAKWKQKEALSDPMLKLPYLFEDRKVKLFAGYAIIAGRREADGCIVVLERDLRDWHRLTGKMIMPEWDESHLFMSIFSPPVFHLFDRKRNWCKELKRTGGSLNKFEVRSSSAGHFMVQIGGGCKEYDQFIIRIRDGAIVSRRKICKWKL